MTNQRIAIVTGGGSGIGLAVARKFTQADILTYVTGRNADKLNRACAELGANARAASFDIGCLEKIPAFVADVIAAHGQIDVLVNNAAVNLKKHILETTNDEFQNIVQTNLVGLFVLTREVGKGMAERKSGNIIHISSMAAHYGIPEVVAYAASKSAVEGMTRAMASDLSPLGVRVNSVAPGFIHTDMTSKAFDNDGARKERVLSRTPMGRMGSPEDIANAVYFLAGDQASFITGEVIKVDGGNSIGF
jgi:NAD(P)-dependent dehydrogenase (short-subunit alcohol dehydrogenase family)